MTANRKEERRVTIPKEPPRGRRKGTEVLTGKENIGKGGGQIPDSSLVRKEGQGHRRLRQNPASCKRMRPCKKGSRRAVQPELKKNA